MQRGRNERRYFFTSRLEEVASLLTPGKLDVFSCQETRAEGGRADGRIRYIAHFSSGAIINFISGFPQSSLAQCLHTHSIGTKQCGGKTSFQSYQ